MYAMASAMTSSSLSTMPEVADVLCLSQSSPPPTICSSIDEASSSSSSSSSRLGGRTIDRHNPIISDSRRNLLGSSSSSLPPIITPHLSILKTKTKSFHKIIKSSIKQKDSSDELIKHSPASSKQKDHSITPPCSSRYLLGDKDGLFFDGPTDFDPVFGSAEDQKKTTVLNADEIEYTTSPPEFPSSEAKPSSSDQVVVLRVSLHCKGCEGKLRKHLSRMKGVTSYNIDFAAKKVTVVGDVTPSSVLASVSKVKNARFWAASATAATTTTTTTISGM